MNFAQTFKALSNPIRRSILELLKAGKLSAGDIAGHFDVAGAVSYTHLDVYKRQSLSRPIEGLQDWANSGFVIMSKKQ